MKYSIIICLLCISCARPVMIYEGPATDPPIWTVENTPAKGEVTFVRKDVTITVKNEGTSNPFKYIVTTVQGMFAFMSRNVSIPVD